MYYLAKASSSKPWDVATSNCWCIGHMKSSVLGNILCDLDPLDLWVKGVNVK